MTTAAVATPYHPAASSRAPFPFAARMAALAAALLIAASFLFPLWSMGMLAPQYPEQLHFNVYAYKFAGGNNPDLNDVAEINTLNHYIGMKELNEPDFPELKLLPAAFGLAFLLLLVVAARGSFGLMALGTGILALAGMGGLGSAYHKLYLYGHNLEPDAPIKMAGFTPPLLGTNHLANFTTTGSFGVGGYLLMVAGLCLLVGLFLARSGKAAA